MKCSDAIYAAKEKIVTKVTTHDVSPTTIAILTVAQTASLVKRRLYEARLNSMKAYHSRSERQHANDPSTMALQLFLAAFASIVSHAPVVITRVNTQTET